MTTPDIFATSPSLDSIVADVANICALVAGAKVLVEVAPNSHADRVAARLAQLDAAATALYARVLDHRTETEREARRRAMEERCPKCNGVIETTASLAVCKCYEALADDDEDRPMCQVCGDLDDVQPSDGYRRCARCRERRYA